MDSNAPKDNLVRALITNEAAHLRATADEGGDGRTLTGHFAVFDTWTEIDSWIEGHFLERIAPGAFARTITENRDRIKVLYDHGYDPQLGNKPLGPIMELSEDKVGAYYEVSLIDTSYNNDFVLPAARAGLLGASFRFSVTAEEWVAPKSATKSNPAKLDERTITDLDLYEFGPVTFPAYQDATAGVRSGTDDFVKRLTGDPMFLVRFCDRAGVNIATRLLEALPPTAQDPDRPAADPQDTPGDPAERRDTDPLPPPAQDSETEASADGQESTSPSTWAERQQILRRIQLDRLGVR